MSDHRVFLIDANALCYRAFFAIKGLTSSKGQATNAVYGFLNTLKKILKEFKPTHMAVCFDVGKRTKRQEKFAAYKVQRPSMPDDLVSQIPLIKDVVRAYRIPIFEQEGYEADDLIATLARKFSGEMEVVIVSDDKDMCQLVNDGVKIYSSRKDELMGIAEVRERFGIDPVQIPDYIGLAGDSSDNIPGVKGIGEVTAKSLLGEFGNVENILNHLDTVKPDKVKEKLMQGRDMAAFSKELALLEGDLPLAVTSDDLKIQKPDYNRLLELFNELEFRRLVDEVSVEMGKHTSEDTRSLKSEDEFDAFLKQLKKKKELVFLVVLQGETEVFYLCQDEQVFNAQAQDIVPFKKIFEDPGIVKITYDVKESKKVLSRSKIDVQGDVFDCLLAGYLLSPNQTQHTIAALAWQYLQKTIPSKDAYEHEVRVLGMLVAPLKKDLKEKGADKLYDEIELPLADVLFKMERNGVNLDVKFLKKLSVESEVKIKEIEDSLYKLAGKEFNLNSPKQLSQVLFEELKLPVIKKTKTGFSTDEEVLTRLADKHPLPALILEYRQIAKLKSTYIDAIPLLVDPETKRIHASFNQTGAETGRLSSSSPNLQNIPIRTELGRQVRRAFIPYQKDHVILSADYSQIELRILAHLSQDEGLIKAFKDDQDIHNYTAALIFDVAEDKVDKAMRNTAKRVNFGIIYGMSAFGLAKDLGISQVQAQDFIEKYFLRYPKVKQFMDESIAFAEKNGYVATLLNRRRFLPEINSPNMGLRQFAQRQAINTPVQGSAADLIKLAMIAIDKELEKRKLVSKLIITVHDELVFDVPPDEQPAMIKLVQERMEGVWELSVPIRVSVKTGSNWLDVKPI